MAIIEVEGLRKVYGGTVAVDGVSFTVNQGEIFGLVGPNGAGKTSIVETLAGLRRPDAGTVRVLGHDPGQERRELAQRIGIQLQSAELPDRLRVWEALDLYASFYRNPADWRDLLAEWGLEDKRNTAFADLSGGLKQRLMVALAFVGSPELVFLDELTTGLDPRARRATWEIVRDIRAKGMTVLLVTHFMDEAEQLCDRVGIVHHGRLVAYGRPSELTTNAAVDVRFSAASGLDLEKVAHALELPTALVREVRPGDYVVDAPATPALVAALAVWLDDQDVLLSDLRAGQGSLEDDFLRLTGEEGE